MFRTKNVRWPEQKMTDVQNEKIRDVRKRKEAMFIITLLVFFLFPNTVFLQKNHKTKKLCNIYYMNESC